MIDVVLPVLDEVDALAPVLGTIPDGFRPIVVDNGSSDGSGNRARQLGAVVVHEPRRGFGSACAAGLARAESDVVCFMDCDGSLDPAELPRVCAPIVAADAELVLGARQATAGAWPSHARAANRLLMMEVRRRSGLRLADLGPMRAAAREQLVALGIRDRRFGWPLEMVLRAAEVGWRIEEVSVAYSPRIGRSKVTGTARGTFLTALDMARAFR